MMGVLSKDESEEEREMSTSIYLFVFASIDVSRRVFFSKSLFQINQTFKFNLKPIMVLYLYYNGMQMPDM